MPLQATSGAASYDAFGGGAAAVPNYIEDVFSTYLYTGTGAAQTITNGIDLSTKGGLVWIKNRSATSNHVLSDTARNANYSLASNLADAETFNVGGILSSFNTNGFSIGTSSVVNASGNAFTSWSFRKSNKFYTQTLVYHSSGTPSTVDLSSLGTVGAVLVKSTNVSGDWYTWHRSLTAGNNIRLNTTAAESTTNAYLSVSGTTLTISSAAPDDFPYVVYAFAHDAGGFGLTGTDNVISCGSFTTDGAGSATVDLGYEPQWLMTKSTTGGSWFMVDNMRQWSNGGDDNYFLANSANAESTFNIGNPTATGFFTTSWAPSILHIYIAIRRGPMKVPTSGTSVYQANTYTGNATANTTVAGNFGFPVDLLSLSNRSADATNWATYGHYMIDRLRGQDKTSGTANSNAESAGWSTYNAFDVQNSIGWGLYGASSNTGYMNYSGGTYVARGFRRAPSFFDEVCYTGNDTIRTLNHNLTVAPELIIVKGRNTTPANTNGWTVYAAPLGNTKYLYLNQTNASATFTGYWNDTTPTASVFTLGTGNAEDTNATGKTYVAYLFATCAGVSKVGSYTGNGTTQTINCGFTGGARFVLIKRTNDTGDWRVWDTARGMVAGTDPNLFLNTTDAEANVNAVYTTTGGFQIVATGTGINASGSTYLFLAIA